LQLNSDSPVWRYLKIGAINPNFPLDRKFVIPAKAGIQMIKKPCEAGQNKGVDRCAKYYFCWIPAFAGMTGLMENQG
jgi:hypothetical protein